MNLKALIIILISALLSACHTIPVYDVEPTAHVPETPIQEDTPTTDIEEEQPLFQTDDLLARIRHGFAFPDLKSKYVSDYEKWDATHPTYLNNLLKRSEPFLYHIVEEIEKRGLPMELALLPAVESAYRPTAVSRSKAAGLWQFIPSTGKSFGLRQDWWYDGRRDVLLSTNAALDYLTQLHKRFDGDWFLALAAYNAGQGTVGKAIARNKRRGKKANYVNLSLRSETKRYVPKLIALKNIINNPQAYNISLPVISNEPHFEVLPLNGQIDLHKFAKESQIDQKQLANLNAGFLRWASAPEGPHRLLIPLNSEESMQLAREAASNTQKINYRHHKIVRGDNLSTIARRYGISVRALKTSNNLRSSAIRAGKTLIIPVRGVAPKKVNVANSKLKPSADNKQSQIVYRVKKGDTLWAIARHYKVQVKELLAWNQIPKNHILKLDQSLILFPN